MEQGSIRLVKVYFFLSFSIFYKYLQKCFIVSILFLIQIYTRTGQTTEIMFLLFLNQIFEHKKLRKTEVTILYLFAKGCKNRKS